MVETELNLLGQKADRVRDAGVAQSLSILAPASLRRVDRDARDGHGVKTEPVHITNRGLRVVHKPRGAEFT